MAAGAAVGAGCLLWDSMGYKVALDEIDETHRAPAVVLVSQGGVVALALRGPAAVAVAFCSWGAAPCLKHANRVIPGLGAVRSGAPWEGKHVCRWAGVATAAVEY